MNLYEKLHSIQCRVKVVQKDGTNQSDKYDFASSENVLTLVRPMMDELGLLLIPRVVGARIHEGQTRSGTARFLTELDYQMVWHDVESGEELSVPWYAQGVDLAGEKGVGKAATYAEKYFILKFFHVPTENDDPDRDGRTGSGEKRQRGTQAGRELLELYRTAIPQMMQDLYSGDAEKIRAGYLAITENKARGYAGAADITELRDTQLAMVYGKVKSAYEKRLGRPFVMKGETETC